MTSLELIKATLPTWPDDVIDQWLLPHSLRPGFGWPPAKDLRTSEWRFVLHHPIEHWQSVQWTLEELELGNADLSESLRQRLFEMKSGYFDGILNAYRATIPNGKERVVRVLAYLARTGRLPRAPVAYRMNGQIDLLDGNHRVLAWTLYKNSERDADWAPREDKTSVWVATPSAG